MFYSTMGESTMRKQSEIYLEMELVKRKIDNKKFKTMICTMIVIGLIWTYFSWDEFNGILGHLTGLVACLFGGFFTYLISLVIIYPTLYCCNSEEWEIKRLREELNRIEEAEKIEKIKTELLQNMSINE